MCLSVLAAMVSAALCFPSLVVFAVVQCDKQSSTRSMVCPAPALLAWRKLSRDERRFWRQATPVLLSQSIPGFSFYPFLILRRSEWIVNVSVSPPQKTCNHEINNCSWTCKYDSHVQFTCKGWSPIFLDKSFWYFFLCWFPFCSTSSYTDSIIPFNLFLYLAEREKERAPKTYLFFWDPKTYLLFWIYHTSPALQEKLVAC